jgi:predicted transcriptional regulator
MARGKKYKSSGARFMQVFHHLYDSRAFRTLSSVAVRVYLELLRRYNGSNDNNLSLTYAELRDTYGLSSATSRKAFKELEAHGLIDRRVYGGLRVGMKTRQCNIFGLSERRKKYDKV